MRYFVIAGLTALAFGITDARPASAYWNCQGPDVACGGHASAAAKPWKQGRKTELTRKHRHVASHSAGHRHVASHSPIRAERHRRSVARSYGGGGGSVGMASYYSSGTRTASGAHFNPGGMTAAHRSLPFGTKVQVTSVATGRSVTVTINDRGPFVRGRIIDLSHGAASALGITGAGVAKVSLSVLGRG